MPFVERGLARIWWNASSNTDGREAVVLLMGLGCSCDMWFRVAPELAPGYRVIVIDNRGVGRTKVRDAVVVHRIDAMADDVAAALDDAGESSAHVVGFSMGGMVAQQFALSYPGRTRSLALLGTHAGAVHSVKAQDAVVRLLFEKSLASPEHSLHALRPYVYARRTRDERIGEDHAVRLDYYPTAHGYRAQLHGIMAWSAFRRLDRIRAPTLVVHGVEDGLIPVANGRMLAERIPGARLEELDDASHWLMTDQTDKTLSLLRSHFSRNT
jgi:3-oxoadipate enol-lactonase